MRIQNNKYLNIILIIILIFLVFSTFNKSTNTVTESSELISPKNNHEFSIERDTFNLILLDRDPFGASKKQKRINTAPVSIKSGIKANSKKPLIWPSISYHGFVKNNQNTTRLILLKVNNRLYRKREQESIDDIVLVKAYNDSLIVQVDNNKKTILKIKE